MIKLLFVDNDTKFGRLIKEGLEDVVGGYKVKWATNGKEGLTFFSETTLDVIVSDIMMPIMDGEEMVKKIRLSNKQIPVILASAKDSEGDVVSGYHSGADLYIKKPFYVKELDAHIKSLLNRSQNQPSKTEKTVYKIGNYTFYPQQYYLEYESQKTKLNKSESKILTLLCENMGKVVKRTDILALYFHGSEDEIFNSRNLDVYVRKLRDYLSADKSISINTLKKVGLFLEVKE